MFEFLECKREYHRGLITQKYNVFLCILYNVKTYFLTHLMLLSLLSGNSAVLVWVHGSSPLSDLSIQENSNCPRPDSI